MGTAASCVGLQAGHMRGQHFDSHSARWSQHSYYYSQHSDKARNNADVHPDTLLTWSLAHADLVPGVWQVVAEAAPAQVRQGTSKIRRRLDMLHHSSSTMPLLLRLMEGHYRTLGIWEGAGNVPGCSTTHHNKAYCSPGWQQV